MAGGRQQKPAFAELSIPLNVTNSRTSVRKQEDLGELKFESGYESVVVLEAASRRKKTSLECCNAQGWSAWRALENPTITQADRIRKTNTPS
jgi:hypothetical protein